MVQAELGDGTSRNSSLGFIGGGTSGTGMKWLVGVEQAEMVHWDGTSRNGSLAWYRQKWFMGWYKQKWFIEVVLAKLVHWDGTGRNGSCMHKWFIGVV